VSIANTKSSQHYTDSETNEESTIDSLFKTHIMKPTHDMQEEVDWLLSIFHDNSGVIAWNDDWSVCMKAETHNSPSALDPYGGAMTGIVGVNRDILGTGLGARPIANTDVFCFGPPQWQGNLPENLFHPSRVLRGVHAGVRVGGNESGIPTVNGAIVFDDRYIGKPLVYCGTVGIMPRTLPDGRPSHIKTPSPDDVVFMVGGRVGYDGIHGATFSSLELTEESPSSAVQIGDPITQKKMLDMLIEARDLGYITCITDNGAGGLSSSVGEMAEYTGGCHIDLAKVPLKQPGLSPWEILVSESQERMTVAVTQADVPAFLALAKLHEVEATAVATFTNSGYFHVSYDDMTVAYLPLSFLHGGVPQLQLKATWKTPEHIEFQPPKKIEHHDICLNFSLAQILRAKSNGSANTTTKSSPKPSENRSLEFKETDQETPPSSLQFMEKLKDLSSHAESTRDILISTLLRWLHLPLMKRSGTPFVLALISQKSQALTISVGPTLSNRRKLQMANSN
jgi:phosphoribosylformylglycinamidine (FGAM) synthase-like enzyme